MHNGNFTAFGRGLDQNIFLQADVNISSVTCTSQKNPGIPTHFHTYAFPYEEKTSPLLTNMLQLLWKKLGYFLKGLISCIELHLI